MATSDRQREANKRNAQMSKGPNDTSRTRYNATKHGILSTQALIRSGEGKEDLEEFQRISDALRKDLEPHGAVQESIVDELIGVHWRKRRVLAYENAVISKKRDEAVKQWDQEQPVSMAINRWGAEKYPKKLKEIFLQSTPDKTIESNIQSGEPLRKDGSGSQVKPTDISIIWLLMRKLALVELTIDDPLSSSTVRGLVCLEAQRMGVDLIATIGSKPESDLFVDCSREQIQDILDSACELKNLSEEEFWDVVFEHAEQDFIRSAEACDVVELERSREADLAGLPDEEIMAKIHRYEVQYSNRFSKLLEKFQELQTASAGLGSTDPETLETES